MSNKSYTSYLELYEELKRRINNGYYCEIKPFPSNSELQNDFNSTPITVQRAVDELMRRGFIYVDAPGLGRRRYIRPTPKRHLSNRKGDFKTEHGDLGHEEFDKTDIITNDDYLPSIVREYLSAPALLYKTKLYRDQKTDNGIYRRVIGYTESYIPSTMIDIFRLHELLNEPGAMIYKSMESLGYRPTYCEEYLSPRIGEPEEYKMFDLDPYKTFIPVIDIKRIARDHEYNLLQVCLIRNIGDCYEFHYQFLIND